MSWRSDVVEKAVANSFKPANASNLIKGTTSLLAMLALLVAGAFATTGLLSWLLWIAAALKVRHLVIGAVVLGDYVIERERRLSSLPPGWRDYLINGGAR